MKAFPIVKDSCLKEAKELLENCALGEFDIVKRIVETNKELMYCRDALEYLPIHWAVRRSHYQICDFLLKNDPQGFVVRIIV